MNRATADNTLLASCDELYSNVIRVAGAFALFVGVGAFWYLIVAIRAGAL